jgi:hypothetical protein
VLRHDRDDYGGIFRALALDGRGIGRHQHIELPKSVCDGATPSVVPPSLRQGFSCFWTGKEVYRWLPQVVNVA